MQSLVIVKPLPFAIVNASSPLARLLTQDPKEAAAMGDTSAVLDFGVAVTIDSAFLGYHTAINGNQWAVTPCDAAGNNAGPALVITQALQSPGDGPPYHAFCKSDPVTTRYLRVDTNAGPQGGFPFLAGILAFGSAFQATWGTEWGAGRTIEDTGSAERLFGGGFGIDDGVAAGGYQWTFGDLSDDERRRLYKLVKERRTTRSVLVVEDPDQTDGLNERIHWGLFQKLTPYERLDPQNTKWALQVGDWA